MPERAPRTPDARRELMLDVLKRFRVMLRSMESHYRSVEARSGLGGAQLWALSEVAIPGGLTVGELAAKLAIHLSTASNLVSRLEELGLARRSRAGADLRVVRVTATAAGRRKLLRAPKPSAGRLQQALMRLPPVRLQAIRADLDHVLALMANGGGRGKSTPLGDLLGTPTGPARSPRSKPVRHS